MAVVPGLGVISIRIRVFFGTFNIYIYLYQYLALVEVGEDSAAEQYQHGAVRK
jgi:hypothetical protein